MNKLFKNVDTNPAVRVFVSNAQFQTTNIDLDAPNNYIFMIKEKSFKIISTSRVLTKIKLEKETFPGIYVVVKQWFANRSPYLFGSDGGTFRITTTGADSKITIRGVN